MGSMRSASIRSKEVFATCGGLLGPYLKRAPDREPGNPRLWISWQLPLLRASQFLGADVSVLRRAVPTIR
jgi:hypothetical protein